MKKIRSIFNIFAVFLVMIIAGFAILYIYSTSSLKESLMQAAKIQMEYSKMLLGQKIKEIEIEADGILNSDDLKTLHLTLIEEYDAYRYVTDVNQMKEYLKGRQKSNVGMAQFILYWPKAQRIITTTALSGVKDVMLEPVEDNQWFIYENEVYFVRKYVTDWDDTDDEPYLIIRMERDYLYKLKTMASGMKGGGTMLLYSQKKSLFSGSETEKELLRSMGEAGEGNSVVQNLPGENLKGGYTKSGSTSGESASYLSISKGKYQLVSSGALKNGLELVSYYPLKEMMRPVSNINRITGSLLVVLLLIGLIFMLLYYNNILLQLRILTGKLKQVEGGNFTAQIMALPNNEFGYVFRQFNRMVTRISQLIESTLKEQQLRNQAELRQLQLQIHPHFLYNSLSYIVTVADQPEAVTEMAVHLSSYYRYCTKNKTITTIGEEVSYAKAYLAITAMRKDLEYSIEVSKDLYDKRIIPLILQPIIENAIEHAIEERENARHIYVKVYELGSGALCFEVSDDGDGMTEEEIDALFKRLSKKEREEEESVGLWNVNQRLINYYDESAGLRFGKSIWGGLMVSFTIDVLPKEMENDGINRR
ncbi:histidine kinase [Anaerocolumna sp. AGMB13020]|uniref:sensor histidine kinase n=1 Tax=Anaerocolumna sp. AGMB13020 TaxID=3081750 RepID=UPI002954730E|nr:histidine kinase [Anaerocolumna sp. AGMB13020]WOO37953.1 histidine kinase [Anaerocolumna sp. AGMB13020]